MRSFGIGILYFVGFVLVACSHSLGIFLVRTYMGPGSFSWNPQEAASMSQMLRLLGGMIFAAGLVERLIVALGPRTDPAGTPPDRGD